MRQLKHPSGNYRAGLAANNSTILHIQLVADVFYLYLFDY